MKYTIAYGKSKSGMRYQFIGYYKSKKSAKRKLKSILGKNLYLNPRIVQM